jgi:hypothetical protein
MFKGTVNFRAAIKGHGITFTSLDFNPNRPGVDRVTIEAPQGDAILSTVHLDSVPSQEDGRLLADSVITSALDRLAYHHGISIEDAYRTREHFEPIHPQPGLAGLIAGYGTLFISGASDRGVVGIPAATAKFELEEVVPAGERHFGLFRSALLSGSPVERYMHLYNLLLMLHRDDFADLDAFIVREEPAVPQTAKPRNRGMETAYTRLRNDFAHGGRTGGNLKSTKEEMEGRLVGLMNLVRKAIAVNP